MLVGGSGLYADAVLGGFDFPGTDPALRAKLEERLAVEGSAALHAELAALDPRSAESILPSNGRRIVRALEVVLLTGAPFQASLPEAGYHYPGTVRVGLSVEKAELEFTVLSDPASRVAGQIGIVFQQADEVLDAQRPLGLDLAQVNAEGSTSLPRPTVLVVDQDRSARPRRPGRAA